LLSHLGA